MNQFNISSDILRQGPLPFNVYVHASVAKSILSNILGIESLLRGAARGTQSIEMVGKTSEAHGHLVFVLTQSGQISARLIQLGQGSILTRTGTTPLWAVPQLVAARANLKELSDDEDIPLWAREYLILAEAQLAIIL
ncbi:hypothetical protein [Mechercharimyces sp. CAU 1602]|uniref:hypothetical protein n=1 Tax=Mechercharimyces sp. CAU 1602 TaxID=2973933 RepID=UPI0021614591|nr:hypothetical protein [Mechercharimyces sp. CAU 1602]MCS1352180.1 hypothetical protein [Mechercharimyces sp. CAU 1602]